LPPDITQEDMVPFAHQVLDRFRNPYIRHRWLSITLQYTAKVRMRVLPVLRTYITRFGQPPAAMALGMAAYIRCMRVTGLDAAGYWGEANGNRYQIQDDHAAWWETVWQTDDPELLVRQVLRQTDIWGEDLTLLPGWEAAVLHALRRILDQGAGVVLGV
jgi:tagaturonate reductase